MNDESGEALAQSLAHSSTGANGTEPEVLLTTARAEAQPLLDSRLSQRQAGLGGIPSNSSPSSLTSIWKSLPSHLKDKGAHTQGTGL